MSKNRGINKPRAVWTAAQEEFVRARYPHEKTAKIAADIGMTVEQTFRKAKSMGLNKTQAYLDSPDACRLRREDTPGIAFRFPKGHVPFNKGVKGISYPGTEATQFKKGQNPRNWKPVGSERYSKEGYLQRKVTDTGYPPRDWVGVHILLWREHHGEVPKGHKIAFKDKNKQKIFIENLEMISDAEMMRRNSFHNNYPKEIVQVIQLRAALNHRINAKEKKCERTTG